MDLYAFKIYMLDVGLLLAMTDLDASVIIDGNRIFTEFKGALTEQYVLQQMIAELGVEPYYYTTANSTGEIDFTLQAPGSVIPGGFCFSEGRICGGVGLGIRFLYVTEEGGHSLSPEKFTS